MSGRLNWERANEIERIRVQGHGAAELSGVDKNGDPLAKPKPRKRKNSKRSGPKALEGRLQALENAYLGRMRGRLGRIPNISLPEHMKREAYRNARARRDSELIGEGGQGDRHGA